MKSYGNGPRIGDGFRTQYDNKCNYRFDMKSMQIKIASPM